MKACMAPMLKEVEQALGENRATEVDTDRVGKYRGMLGQLWQRLVGEE
jgi:hypothetical protein